MKIVLDGYWWARGTQSLQHVVHGLTKAWVAEFPEDQVTLLVRRRERKQLQDLPQTVEVVSTRVWPQGLAAMVSAPWYGWRRKADAVITHNFAPLFGANRAVFIQDFIFATHPEWFSKTEVAYFRPMTWAARRAHHIFSSTTNEALRISRYSGNSRVYPVGLGIDSAVFTASACPVPGLVPGQFLLTSGRLNVRKNVSSVIEGARASGRISEDFPMVVVGSGDRKPENFADLTDELEALGALRFLGFIDIGELVWLIQNCSLYMCLSLDEGFGLPPVEAAALGANVLVSNLAVFRENLGNSASYVHPQDIDAIARAVIAATTTPPEHRRIEDVNDLLSRHSWRRVVRQMRAQLAENGQA